MIVNYTRVLTIRSLVAAAGLLLAGIALHGAAKPGDAAKGKDLFSQNCDVCHNTDSTDVKVGPGLKGLFKKPSLQNKKKVTDASVMDIIDKGSPSGMPGFAESLTVQERANVLAYLKTL